MGFEMRRKGKYKGAEKFIMKMKEIQEEAKAVLEKAQEEMKKYADRKRAEVRGRRGVESRENPKQTVDTRKG